MNSYAIMLSYQCMASLELPHSRIHQSTSQRMEREQTGRGDGPNEAHSGDERTHRLCPLIVHVSDFTQDLSSVFSTLTLFSSYFSQLTSFVTFHNPFHASTSLISAFRKSKLLRFDYLKNVINFIPELFHCSGPTLKREAIRINLMYQILE